MLLRWDQQSGFRGERKIWNGQLRKSVKKGDCRKSTNLKRINLKSG